MIDYAVFSAPVVLCSTAAIGFQLLLRFILERLVDRFLVVSFWKVVLQFVSEFSVICGAAGKVDPVRLLFLNVPFFLDVLVDELVYVSNSGSPSSRSASNSVS